MTITKENRSVYLDEEIELLGKTVLRQSAVGLKSAKNIGRLA